MVTRFACRACVSIAWLTFFVVLAAPRSVAEAASPHIVLIMADDMGYGDVHALNPSSTIPTPHLDRLARQGMTFTDAHTPSGVCTPTRYGLLTGRYCWRSSLKRGVLGGYSPPLIDKDRLTIAGMLKQKGYVTGAVGKWHLGMNMPMKKDGDRSTWQGDPGIDWSARIEDSPITRGFDYYFGVSASLDMAPYVYVENDGFTMKPMHQQKAVRFPDFVRAGPRAEDFVIDEVLDRLADKATGFIAKHARGDKPFFLYMPLTAPHKPTTPHKRFAGKTDLGPYGDFIVQVDDTAGRVLKAIDEAGIADNTLVIFTSDNGSYMYRYDDADRKDHVDDPTVQGYRAAHHRANGPWRGTKADIYEGGHHVAFFARWPGRIEAGSKCAEPICLTDVFATCAEIVGASLGSDVAEDSLSLWPMMAGKDAKRGVPVIYHSAGGMFAIREGKWKLILGDGSGGRERPAGKPFGKPYQLYDMSADAAETTNLVEQQAEVAERLAQRFQQIHDSGRSVDREAGKRPALHWPQWRGPGDNGAAVAGRYATKFSDTDNVEWKVTLPGKGCSTPAVWGDLIFITAPLDDQDALLAYDWQGNQRFATPVGKEKPGRHRNGSGSNPSPTTDGQRIYVYYKSGNLAAVDFAGKLLWSTNLQDRFAKDTLYWDVGTSPVLTRKHVVVAVMHEGESYLAAFDKGSGDLVWKVSRNYECPVEGDHSYATPHVMRMKDGRQAIVVWGAEHITMHDARDGSRFFECGGFNPKRNRNWVVVGSSVIAGDMVIVPYGRGSHVAGVRLTGEGDVTETNRIWTRNDTGCFVPIPAVHDGKLYILKDRGEVECLNPATGESLWNEKLPRGAASYYSSPVIADGKLYAAREDGVFMVARIDGKFELLAENDMGQRVIACPVPVGDRLLIRGESDLFCIAAPAAE